MIFLDFQHLSLYEEPLRFHIKKKMLVYFTKKANGVTIYTKGYIMLMTRCLYPTIKSQ